MPERNRNNESRDREDQNMMERERDRDMMERERDDERSAGPSGGSRGDHRMPNRSNLQRGRSGSSTGNRKKK